MCGRLEAACLRTAPLLHAAICSAVSLLCWLSGPDRPAIRAPAVQGMQPVGELPALGALPPMPAPLVLGPAPFLQTSFGEVLSARMAGAVPKGSPFSSAMQLDGEPPLLALRSRRFRPGFAAPRAGLSAGMQAQASIAVAREIARLAAASRSQLLLRQACCQQFLPSTTALCPMPGQHATVPTPRPAGLLAAQATPVKAHPAAAGAARHPATPLEAHTPVSAQAARSSAGRRPLSADTCCDELAEQGAAGGQGDANPLAFLAIAASMDE